MKKKILLIGRNPDLVAKVQAILSAEGHDLGVALRDEDALALLAEESFDALVIGEAVGPQSRDRIRAAAAVNSPSARVIDRVSNIDDLFQKLHA